MNIGGIDANAISFTKPSRPWFFLSRTRGGTSTWVPSVIHFQLLHKRRQKKSQQIRCLFHGVVFGEKEAMRWQIATTLFMNITSRHLYLLKSGVHLFIVIIVSCTHYQGSGIIIQREWCGIVIICWNWTCRWDEKWSRWSLNCTHMRSMLLK